MSAAAMATAATVKSTTATVEPAASTMETATAVEPAGPMKPSAVGPVTSEAARVTAPPVSCSSVVSAASVVAPAPIVSVAPAAAPSMSPAIPGAGADEHAAGEPVRPVVTVRRASVRIISVVAVSTRRRYANVARSKPYTHTDLRL